MKIELKVGWKDRVGLIKPRVDVTIDGDQVLADEVYSHLREFEPAEKSRGLLEFVVE